MARSILFLVSGLLASVAIGYEPAAAQDAAPAAPVAVASQSIAVRWNRADAETLVAAIDAAADEGLRPEDYHPAALRRALDGGEGAALDAAAEASAIALAHDYLLGHVADRESFDWHIRPSADAESALPAQLDAAVAAGRLRPFLAALLPADPRYAALREALRSANDPALRAQIRANMERWRWMPRALGASYLYVNVPSYRLQVVDNDMVQSTWTVVVGAPDTPTPALASDTSSLVVNPWWNVPQSIVKKSGLRPGHAGFIFKAAAGGQWQVRQPPGPRNSLGRIKFNLVNDQAIYLHDTPAKALFARSQRALSHGCIRVKNIDALASALVATDGVPDPRFDDALAGDKTQTVRLARTWPVYLVYFTVDQDAAGKMIRYGDPYGRDAALAARLDGEPLGASLTVASN